MNGYKLPQWNQKLYKCCGCGLIDSPLYVGESDEEGKPAFIHRVAIDLVYIDRTVLTRRELAQGYAYMKIADRNAKVRTICRECLSAADDVRGVWEDFNTMREKLDEDSKPPSWWNHFCS